MVNGIWVEVVVDQTLGLVDMGIFMNILDCPIFVFTECGRSTRKLALVDVGGRFVVRNVGLKVVLTVVVIVLDVGMFGSSALIRDLIRYRMYFLRGW